MLTPFSENGTIDFAGLGALIEWYLAHKADALFAVCQSSEMWFLTLEERADIARFVVERVNGRVPVVASGHVADDPGSQADELNAMYDTGIDALVMVTNRLDPEDRGADEFKRRFEGLVGRLPADAILGLYECPAPYRRLLSDAEIAFCAGHERLVLLKDVCCDLPTIRRRLAITNGTGLTIINANAAIAFEAMQAGSRGFCGVFNNIHPDLYAWLYTQRHAPTPLAEELSEFLVMAGAVECLGYPAMAKLYHRHIGTFHSITCRCRDDDILETIWAIEPIVEKLIAGTNRFRAKIAALDSEAA